MRGVERSLAEDVSGESLLNVLILGGVLPEGRSQFEHAAVRPARQQAEQVAQVGPRLDAVKLAARQQRHEGRVDLAGVVAADEKPVAPANDFAPQLQLAPIVVNRQTPVLEKSLERLALVAR